MAASVISVEATVLFVLVLLALLRVVPAPLNAIVSILAVGFIAAILAPLLGSAITILIDCAASEVVSAGSCISGVSVVTEPGVAPVPTLRVIPLGIVGTSPHLVAAVVVLVVVAVLRPAPSLTSAIQSMVNALVSGLAVVPSAILYVSGITTGEIFVEVHASVSSFAMAVIVRAIGVLEPGIAILIAI